MSSLLGGK